MLTGLQRWIFCAEISTHNILCQTLLQQTGKRSQTAEISPMSHQSSDWFQKAFTMHWLGPGYRLLDTYRERNDRNLA